MNSLGPTNPGAFNNLCSLIQWKHDELWRNPLNYEFSEHQITPFQGPRIDVDDRKRRVGGGDVHNECLR